MTTATLTTLAVTFDRAALLDALSLACQVASPRSPRAALKCVLIEARESDVRFTATDLEVWTRTVTPRCDVNEPGVVLVPADTLRAAVSRISDPTVKLTQQNQRLTVAGAGAKFTIDLMKPEDYPTFQSPDAQGGTVNAAAFGGSLGRVLFAAGKENSRYSTQGVLLHASGKACDLVTTDGHRLALDRLPCEIGTFDAIIPTRAAKLIAGMAKQADGQAEIAIGDGAAHVTLGDTEIIAQLMEGNFPPYQDVIPKGGDKRATASRADLIDALSAAGVMTNDESKGVRMAFGRDGLTLTSRAVERGEAEVSVALASYTGDPIEIGFNPAYLLDALRVLDSDVVQMEMQAPNKPGVLKSEAFTYVAMPIQLQ